MTPFTATRGDPRPATRHGTIDGSITDTTGAMARALDDTRDSRLPAPEVIPRR